MVKLLTSIQRYWLSVTLFILTVITISSLSPLQELPPLPGSDKTHHLIAYGGLMFPIALRKPKYWWLISLFLTAWSGVIELIQPYVNRYGEWQDILANITGLFCGWSIVQIIKWRFPLNLQ